MLPKSWRPAYLSWREDEYPCARQRAPAPVDSARAAGLRYTTDAAPGITRRRSGSGFTYFTAAGRVLKDPAELHRIRSLVIPPAWEDVWICSDPRGHLQATGRDARGRKQYRYHPRWREVRDETKYLPSDRLRADPSGRKATHRRRSATSGSAERESARRGRSAAGEDADPGGQRRVRTPESLVRPHDAAGWPRRSERRTVTFAFRGKSGVEHEVDLDDRRLARVVKACRDLPGYELFQYLDEEGKRQSDRVVGRERVPARDHWRGLHVEGLSHVGGHGACGAAPARLRSLRLGRPGQAQHRSRPSRRWRSGSATRRRCAGSATSTRRYSTPTWTARWSRRCRSGPDEWRRAPARSRRERRPCSDCCSDGSPERPAAARADLSSSIQPVTSARGELDPAVRAFDLDHRPAAVHPRFETPAARVRRFELQAVGVDAAVGDAGGDCRRGI